MVLARLQGMYNSPLYVQESHQGHLSAHCSHYADHCLMMPVPLQLRIILLFKPNLVKKVRCSSVHGQRGQKIRASRDHIRKDISRFLGVLDTTP